jgi:sugar lactone lactonase YvrE
VGEYGGNRLQAFQLPSKSGTTIPTTVSGILGIYYDDDTSTAYVTEYSTYKLSKWPSGQTLPPTGTTTACNAGGGWFGLPYGVIVDRQGNTYVSHNSCNTLVKWTPNATKPILIGGTGTSGSSSLQLNSPRHIYLDENNAFIYVADTNNHRIQRFTTNGNGTGVTVAGGHGSGAASNQLNSPTGVYVSQKDGSIYISDQNNNRIQKWTVNATSGVTVAGNSNGTSGNGSFALKNPFAIVLDPTETYMYIADYYNNRVQRYPVI